MNIAIIGAGAAGCFAAANLKLMPDRKVTVYEKTAKALQKVKVSGGGRCNVTHEVSSVPALLKKYPRGIAMLRKSMPHFTPQDLVEWLAQRGVVVKTEADGRVFPITDSSQTIIDCLWKEMQRNDVTVQYSKGVSTISPEGNGWTITFQNGDTAYADKVLVASGGYAKAEGFNWLKALGHSIQKPVPSLFTFNLPKNPITQLMGLVVQEATVKIKGTKISETGPVLITHWGLSGPAILRTSAWAARELAACNYEFTTVINWLKDVKEDNLRTQFVELRQKEGRQMLHGRNSFGLPRRLWDYLLENCEVDENTRWGDLPAKQQNKLIQKLTADEYAVRGKTTFKEEFVTAGGVMPSEINPQTMESKLHSGLYFAGEVMDVDGITGGFNFQHAWNSGWLAAQAISI